jgi:DNA-binding response OmpR family regulator
MCVSMTLPQYRRRKVIVDGVPIHLTPHEAELVALLLTSSPDVTISKETLVEAIWPHPDTQAETAFKIIDVLVGRCRKKGVPIVTDWGWGFSIVERGASAPQLRLAA